MCTISLAVDVDKFRLAIVQSACVVPNHVMFSIECQLDYIEVTRHYVHLPKRKPR